MQARMTNPATLLPEAVKGINALYKAAHSAGVPTSTLELVHLRSSQINGCGACADSGARAMRKAGRPTTGCSRSPPGARRRTSPTPSGPRWSWPSTRPGWPTGPTRCRTTSGRRRPSTSARTSWPRSCCGSRPRTCSTG
ncbi:carboxymuconolactone decarboxylase family protein [Catellatospora bangladeshensis]|uniref:carboxymuconolactone decarboxylase family protein n=1 Tax=Catellatospora bangladeshensis TaxID=310355 RepID=UPI003609BAF6